MMDNTDSETFEAQEVDAYGGLAIPYAHPEPLADSTEEPDDRLPIAVVYLDKRVRDEWGGIRQATDGSAGFDLFAACINPIQIGPGQSKLITTGVQIWIKDPRVVGMVFPRSGMGVNRGLILGNGTGIFDSDYLGEWKVCLWNRKGSNTEIINPGDRIAQVVFVPVVPVRLHEMKAFAKETDRGDGGMGSTGK